MRWLLWIGILAFGCKQPILSKEESAHNPIDSLLDQHVSKLATEAALVTLSTCVDGACQTENVQGKDQYFWKKKFQSFRELAAVFTAFRKGEYEKTTQRDPGSNLTLITWSATAQQPVRALRMHVLPSGAILKIEAQGSVQSFLTAETKAFLLEFSSLGQDPRLARFSVSGTQQFFGLRKNSFLLEGVVR